jgi:hypothetical protein
MSKIQRAQGEEILQSAPKAGDPTVSFSTQAHRHPLSPAQGVVDTHADQTSKTRTLTTEDDAVSKERRCGLASDYAGEFMQLLDVLGCPLIRRF